MISLHYFMLNTRIRFAISLSSLKTNNNRSRNLIVHHGLMGSSRNFRTIVKQPIVTCRFNTFLIDARNHGESPHTQTHTVEELADDLLEYVEEEGLGQRLTLVGHSMGGLALMEFTKRHPQAQKYVDRVIIIDIPSDPVKNYPSFQNTGDMLKALTKIDLSLPLPAIHQEIDKTALSKDVGALLKSNLAKREGGQSLRWTVNLPLLAYEGYDNVGNYSLAEGHSRQWHKPVEYIYGGKSNYYDSSHHSRYCEYYPHMKDHNFHGVKEAGHWVHADRPAEFMQILENIVARDD